MLAFRVSDAQNSSHRLWRGWDLSGLLTSPKIQKSLRWIGIWAVRAKEPTLEDKIIIDFLFSPISGLNDSGYLAEGRKVRVGVAGLAALVHFGAVETIEGFAVQSEPDLRPFSGRPGFRLQREALMCKFDVGVKNTGGLSLRTWKLMWHVASRKLSQSCLYSVEVL